MGRCYDHRPILATCNSHSFLKPPKERLFQYEVRWDLDKDCRETVDVCWNEGRVLSDPLDRVSQKLKNCQDGLKRWKALTDKNRSQTIKIKSNQMKALQELEGPNSLEEQVLLQRETHCLMDQEELKWKQRAKKYWYRNGDWNTKFFHACANQRRRKNLITTVLDEN